MKNTSTFDVAIVGGGIVGLATALQLTEQRPGIRVVILEKEKAVGQHQSGHNSNVIHSGIYYKPGSLKAINCQKGYQQLLDFCEKHGVETDICGKVIVATEEKELPILENIWLRGHENGLAGLEKIGPEQIREREPHCTGIAGIWVPQTGIIHFPDVCDKYAEVFKANGGEIRLGHAVKNIVRKGSEMTVETAAGDIQARQVVNCAGLWSDKIAQKTSPDLDLKILPFRGEYYEIVPESCHLVKNLIYPVPNPAFPFLGVHYTRMIKGGVEAGPNAVLAFRREGYKNSDIHLGELFETLLYPGFQKVAMKYWRDGLYEMYRSYSKAAFVRALQKLIPEIKGSDLRPGGAGVRAQACDSKGNLIDDFLFVDTPGVINVCNAPSPAATSSLAIGETVAERTLAQLV